jgi:hypothetical protein
MSNSRLAVPPSRSGRSYQLMNNKMRTPGGNLGYGKLGCSSGLREEGFGNNMMRLAHQQNT